MGSDTDVSLNVRAPLHVADLGLTAGLAEDLFTRTLYRERSCSIGHLAGTLAVSPSVANELAESLREKAIVEYLGLDGRDYRITLTESGSRQTADRLRSAAHSASMPVPVAHYRQLVELQRAEVTIDRDRVKRAFGDLVVEDAVMDQVGPAFAGTGAIFIYGPAGTGKTSLVERMSNFYEDLVLIPRYVVVDGQLIAVFDPSVHQPVDQPKELDPRYVLCRRPLIMVGGELSMDMMDLRYDSMAGLSLAPIQMQANNGILAIDDFGRQTISPDEILNRWIVPLSRGVDFLRPASGSKFTVPFELKLVISTNLAPSSLGDEAFMRRLRNKIFVGACTPAAFNWILARAADAKKIELSPDAAQYLAEITVANYGELRPYVAADFCDLAVDICNYDGLPRTLDPRLIDRIANLCFVHDDGPRPRRRTGDRVGPDRRGSSAA